MGQFESLSSRMNIVYIKASFFLCKDFRCSELTTNRVVLFSVYTLCSRTTWHTPTQLVSISTVYFRPTWHPAGPLGWYSSKYTLFIFELLGTCLHNWGDNYRISAALGRCCMQRDRWAGAHQSPHCLVHICINGADQNLHCLL